MPMKMIKRIIEHLVAWLALALFAYWTIACALGYAIMGGWGGTRYIDTYFIFFILNGYGVWGLLLLLGYLMSGRVRFLPWLRGEKPVRDLGTLLISFSAVLAYYFVFIMQ